jgi:hypothetical protein
MHRRHVNDQHGDNNGRAIENYSPIFFCRLSLIVNSQEEERENVNIVCYNDFSFFPYAGQKNRHQGIQDRTYTSSFRLMISADHGRFRFATNLVP